MSQQPASGIITLTTDYGLRDPFVGIVTGQILARFPAARVVSLTHAVTPFMPDEAGFWLARSWREFPAGTVHVAVVDPGVGTQRELIALTAAGHIFLAPDNGLLDRVRRGVRVEHCHRLDLERLAALDIRARSHTFHGRDLLAPAAAELASGRVSPADLGPASLLGALLQPERTPGEGSVVVVDHFGNLISDLEFAEVAALNATAVRTGAVELPLRRTYGDVPTGSPLALVNSFGLVELAVNGGSAAQVLGAGRGTPLRLVPGRSRS
jgi:S-adenosyl-L-methionine hydrolase (adenosine-forming)